MLTKNQRILGLLREIEAKASNRAAANKLLAVVREVKQVVEARQTLGEDPDLSKLPGLYAKVEVALDGFNQANIISMPTLEEVSELVNAAASVNE